MKPIPIFVFVITFLNVFCATTACKGCVGIDEFNFEKIVPRFEAVLVKFDVVYPYGGKHQIFENVAAEVLDNSNFIMAQVGVKDYGEKENSELAEKYGIESKEDLPALRLFVKGEDEPFIFEKGMSWTEENIKKFIREHTNIYLGLPGCLETFDKLAMKFISSNDKEAVFQETNEKADSLTGQREKAAAKVYVKYMRKVIDSGLGVSFVYQEISRLEKILKDGKLTDKKKEELSHRINTLRSFALQQTKTEL